MYSDSLIVLCWNGNQFLFSFWFFLDGEHAFNLILLHKFLMVGMHWIDNFSCGECGSTTSKHSVDILIQKLLNNFEFILRLSIANSELAHFVWTHREEISTRIESEYEVWSTCEIVDYLLGIFILVLFHFNILHLCHLLIVLVFTVNPVKILILCQHIQDRSDCLEFYWSIFFKQVWETPCFMTIVAPNQHIRTFIDLYYSHSTPTLHLQVVIL